MCTDRFSALKASARCSGCRMGRVTDACIRSRLRRGSCLRARRAECWECCQELSGSLQAMETIKLMIGRGESLVGRLLLFDALALKFRELKLRKNPNCPMCGTHRKIHQLIDYYEFCGVRGEEAPELDLHVPEITPHGVKAADGPRRRPVYSGCSRTARIPDLQFERAPDSAGRIAAAGARTGLFAMKSWRIAGAESVRRKRWIFCAKPDFAKVLNLRGGILSWSTEVDPTVPRY